MSNTSNQLLTSLNVSDLNGTNGFTVINTGLPYNFLGWYASSAGDINGDGFDDLLVGDRFAGKTYVIFGQAGGLDPAINVSTLNGNNGFVVNGSYGTGNSVSSAGDINGDGFDDIIIGRSSSSGISYVVFGQAEGFDPSFDLFTLNGTNGFVINNINAGTFSSVRSVSSAGDVNGDSLDDIVISTDSKNYVVFGKTGGFSASLDLSALNATMAL